MMSTNAYTVRLARTKVGGIIFIIKASLRSEKTCQNIDIYRGFMEKFRLFWDHREALFIIYIDLDALMTSEPSIGQMCDGLIAVGIFDSISVVCFSDFVKEYKYQKGYLSIFTLFQLFVSSPQRTIFNNMSLDSSFNRGFLQKNHLYCSDTVMSGQKAVI